MKILITGACGFIGSNLVERLSKKHEVFGIDNLSRKGSMDNFKATRNLMTFRNIDITNPLPDLGKFDVIYHMAAQVGVQASIVDPMNDFRQNILGTLNVLEYARKDKPLVLYASTNKVYGELQVDAPVSESTPLDFHTPYGVSKGAADQYVLDYDRIYGVPGVVLRQSCIYGKNQLGTEEQGWVAWFLIADHTQQDITIYGDGNQRRDVLYVDDLVDLYELLGEQKITGYFNVGGGPDNTLSLNELVKKARIKTTIKHADWRPSDQKYYVSDISKIHQVTGWCPSTGVVEGLQKTRDYVEERWPKLAF